MPSSGLHTISGKLHHPNYPTHILLHSIAKGQAPLSLCPEVLGGKLQQRQRRSQRLSSREGRFRLCQAWPSQTEIYIPWPTKGAWGVRELLNQGSPFTTETMAVWVRANFLTTLNVCFFFYENGNNDSTDLRKSLWGLNEAFKTMSLAQLTSNKW